MDKYIILPSSGDLNRGDQALVWETVDIAKKSGYEGDFFALSGESNVMKQSIDNGLHILTPILKHPSRKFKSKKNNQYSILLIAKWGAVAFVDLIFSMMLLTKFTRALVEPFLSHDEKKTIKIFKESNACFVKGGGFIHSSGKLTDSYTVYFQLFHIMLAQSLGKKVFVMPNSFGPFDGFAVSWLVKKALRKTSLVTVRESISKSMLDDIGVQSELYPDLGFSLKRNEKDYMEIEKIRTAYPNRKLVAITARPYRFPKSKNPEESYKEYIESMRKFSKWLYETGFLPVFVEHTLSETTHENDGTAISEIIHELNEFEFAMISNDAYNCRDLKYIYAQMDYTVGTRFHSVIFSLSEGVPSIAIEYGGNKGAGILKDMNIADCGMPIEDITFEKLKKSFNYILENEAEIKNKIQIYLEYVKIKRSEIISKINKSLLNYKK